MASAWVNFNGTGTVAIRDSYNVSSITDNAAGNYVVNFAVAMANVNYSAVASTHRMVNWANGGIDVLAYTLASVSVNNVENGATVDTNLFSVTILGGQA